MGLGDAVTSRYELFVATATVAAHAERGESGFRQRDVRFLIELFSNWVETTLEESVVPLQNTQIARYLSTLAHEGYARVLSRKGTPHYRLTRVGLLELIARAIRMPMRSRRAQFFFLFYFIDSYRPHLEAMVKAEGSQFPYALKIELEGLLDTRELVRREIDETSRDLRKLEERIQEALKTAEFVKRGQAKGEDFGALVREVQRRFPYELNSQKPLTELIGEIPPAMRAWEMVEGNFARVDSIWKPHRELLKGYLKELHSLQGRLKETSSRP